MDQLPPNVFRFRSRRHPSQGSAGKAGEVIVLPRPQLDTGVFLSVSVCNASSPPEFENIANVISRGIELDFIEWRWIRVDKPIFRTRYILQCRVDLLSFDRFMIVAEMRNTSTNERFEKTLYPSFLRRSEFQANMFSQYARKELFIWASESILDQESLLGEEMGWKSQDSHQCVIWGYILWLRCTKTENLMARELARKAIMIERDYSRGYALFAQTCVEGIAYDWDYDLVETKFLLHRASLQAWSLDQADMMAAKVRSDDLLYQDEVAEAVSYTNRLVKASYIYPMAMYGCGLAHSYYGEFEAAEDVYVEQLRHVGKPRDKAIGLQYYAQTLSILNRPDEGVNAASEALKINPRSVAALRTLASNLVGIGKEEEAQEACRKAEEISPGFTFKAFKKQPWCHRAWSKLSLHVERIHAAGVT